MGQKLIIDALAPLVFLQQRGRFVLRLDGQLAHRVRRI
jgi:hypothetical protein